MVPTDMVTVLADTASARFMGTGFMAAPITGEDTTGPIGKRELYPPPRGLDKKPSFLAALM